MRIVMFSFLVLEGVLHQSLSKNRSFAGCIKRCQEPIHIVPMVDAPRLVLDMQPCELATIQVFFLLRRLRQRDEGRWRRLPAQAGFPATCKGALQEPLESPAE